MWLPMNLLRQRSSREMPQARSSAAENQPGTGDLPSLPCMLFLWRKTLPKPSEGNGRSGRQWVEWEGEASAGTEGCAWGPCKCEQDALYPWRTRNGCAKWLPKIPCILTLVCADSSSYQYPVLCLCSVSWTVPEHRQPPALPYGCPCCAAGSLLSFTISSSAMR